jgi:site-specific DNA-methyltransferase (adenine-specific)
MPLLYDDGAIRLYVGRWQDNPEWMEADVLVTDPPYGMQYSSASSKRGPTAPVRGDGDTKERDRMLSAWGSAKPALVFGTWRMPRPVDCRQLLIWDKGASPGMGDLTLPWGPSHEDIYVLGGHGPSHWTGGRTGSVIQSRAKEGNAERGSLLHPTQKPVYIMQALITRTTGATIADPFAGSGTTLVAAKLMGRRAIGVEMDARYAEIAAERLGRIPA